MGGPWLRFSADGRIRVATRSPLSSGHLRGSLTRSRFSICTTRTMLYSLNWRAAGAQGPGARSRRCGHPSIACRRAPTRGVGESRPLLKGGGHGISGCAHGPRTGGGQGRAGPRVNADTVLDKAVVRLWRAPMTSGLRPRPDLISGHELAGWDGCPYAMRAGPPPKNCGKRKRS
jgi:hypothetical protein